MLFLSSYSSLSYLDYRLKGNIFNLVGSQKAVDLREDLLEQLNRELESPESHWEPDEIHYLIMAIWGNLKPHSAVHKKVHGRIMGALLTLVATWGNHY